MNPKSEVADFSRAQNEIERELRVKVKRIYLRVGKIASSEVKRRVRGFLWLFAFLSLSLTSQTSNIITLRFFPHIFSLPFESVCICTIHIYTTTTEKKKTSLIVVSVDVSLFCVLFLFPFCYCCSTSLCFCDSFFFGANHSPIFILSHSCTNIDHKKLLFAGCVVLCRVFSHFGIFFSALARNWNKI